MLDASEMEAVKTITAALDALGPESRLRVMLYMMGRLDAAGAVKLSASGAAPLEESLAEAANRQPGAAKTSVIDIRTLKEAKAPRSDVEMAAVVAYYLQEEAPPRERKDSLNRSDIEKYFKQAGHRLPKRPEFTLNNAKNAGYLDVAGKGRYHLNPVGYNLVAHNLPSAKRRSAKPTQRRIKKPQQSKK